MDYRMLIRRGGGALLLTLVASAYSAQGLAQGTWTTTGGMSVPRTQHTGTRLASGAVLVAGGITTGGVTTGSAEIYDPVSGTWSVTAAMIVARSRQTQTVLLDSRVLVTGGRFRGVSLPDAEIYDPIAGTWSATAPMNVPRDNHVATLLLDGRVLVTGGVSGGDGGSPAEKSAEIYDPQTGAWTLVDHLSVARYNHQATRLADGRVLITGGFNISAFHIPLQSAEIYDPARDRWSNAANMTTPRATHAAALLPDGRVLVAAGWTQPPNAITLTASAEIYDAATDSWSAAASLPAARGSLINHAVVLADGDLLVAGGRLYSGSTATAERYDAASGTWIGAGSMSAARSGATATLLADGRVLVAGGGNAGGVLASAEIYVP